MNFLELTKARYSCRDYQPTSVEKEKLDYIMECVRFAPSAVNKQPWRFHIVTSEEDKAKLTQCYRRDWLKSAPMYIIASHGDIDIAIAVEHLCLAATEQGLATCWVCNFDANLCMEQFGMPENEEPAVIIPLGYAADEMKAKCRKAIDDIVTS